MQPDRIIERYKDDMDYTDFANGEKRLMKKDDPNFNPNIDDVKYHSNKLLELLQSFNTD